MKLTNKQRAALEWFVKNDGVMTFHQNQAETPSTDMIFAVVKRGWVERRSPGLNRCLTHHITPAGRAALKEDK